MSDDWWKTNPFRVLDIDKFDSNGLFSRVCEVWKDDDGFVTLFSSDHPDCFLISGYELNPVPRQMIIECGGNPDKIQLFEGVSSFDPEEEVFHDIWGFEILDTCLPAGEVVIALVTRPGFGKGFAWREGMTEGEVLEVNALSDVIELAAKEFGEPNRKWFGWPD